MKTKDFKELIAKQFELEKEMKRLGNKTYVASNDEIYLLSEELLDEELVPEQKLYLDVKEKYFEVKMLIEAQDMINRHILANRVTND